VILNRRQLQLLVPLGVAISLSLPGDQTLYAVLPTQAGEVGISLGMVGVLLGVNRAIRIPGNPIAGLLYDRGGRRPLFLLGLLLGVLSTVSYAFARGFGIWLAGRLLWGMAWSLINVGGLTMVLDVTGDHDRGRVTGLYQLSYLLGLAFSPVLGGLLTDALGFHPALLVGAAITGGGLIIALLSLPETRATPPAAADRPTGRLVRASGVSESAWRAGIQRIRAFLLILRGSDRRLLAVNYIYLMTFFAGNGVVMSTISLYLKQLFGDELVIGEAVVGVASMGGALLAVRSLVGMAAGPLSGYLSDRLGDRWLIVQAGIGLGGAGFGVLIVGGSIWSVSVGVGLIAASTGALLTTLAALVGDLAAAERQGQAIGGLATSGDIGSAAGPLLAYALLALLDLRWVYLLCALGFASSLLALRYVAVLRKHNRRWSFKQ